MGELGDRPFAGPQDTYTEALAKRCSHLSGEIATILGLIEKGVSSEKDAAPALEKYIRELSLSIRQIQARRTEHKNCN
jgi:hypothetical protein